MLKSSIFGVYSHTYTKIKINSDDDLPFEKTLTIDNDVVFVKSVFNKIHNQYYYKTFIKNVHINNL